MHKIEREIIKATDFKPRQKYADRQDYLKSLLLAVTKLEDDDFDNLSDDAAAWANACIAAHNSKDKSEYPDFDEPEKYQESDEDEEASEDAEETDEPDEEDEGEEADEPSEDDEEEDEAEEASSEEADEAEEEDEPSEDEESDPDEEEMAEDEPEDEDEPEEDPKPKAKKPAKKAKAPAKKPVKAPKIPKPEPKPRKTIDREGDVQLDKWGCMEGSKNGQALAMFEKGATSREVREALGGTYYNILGKMVRDGHTLERKDGVFTLIHKDEVGKKPTKKKK